MTILWSPEAIEDLTLLRAYIADDNPAAARGVVRFTSYTISNSYFPTIRRWVDPAAFLARASSSSPGRHSLSPIDCREISFRYCAYITERAVGLIAFSGTVVLNARAIQPIVWRSLNLLN